MNLQSTLSNTIQLSQLQLVNEFEDYWFTSEEVGHITCMALRQSHNTFGHFNPVQPAESAGHILRMSKTIHTNTIWNVRPIIIQ